MKTNTQHWQYSDPTIREVRVAFIELLPAASKQSLNYVDSELVDYIRSIPWPNNISELTISNMHVDIAQMIQLMGEYQHPNPIERIRDAITNIHTSMALKELPTNTVPVKGASTIKNWVRYLRGLHPRVDLYIRANKEIVFRYFRDVCESLGENTILYSSDPSSIDISAWGNQTDLTTNAIDRSSNPFFACNYIRETMREKLDSEAVYFTQTANTKTQVGVQRNLPTEAWKTTAPLTGGEIWQIRPVLPQFTQGAHLNSDWYHWQLRVQPPVVGLKEKCMMDVMDYLDSYYDRGDFTVHVLVNHLHPLKPYAAAEKHAVVQKLPIGVEETFPTKDVANIYKSDLKNRPIFGNAININNIPLAPTIV